MSTHTITRSSVERQRVNQSLRAANAAQPDPDAWHTFLCTRCDTPFKVQGIKRHCAHCIQHAANNNITGSETIGEVSGA